MEVTRLIKLLKKHPPGTIIGVEDGCEAGSWLTIDAFQLVTPGLKPDSDTGAEYFTEEELLTNLTASRG